LIGLGAAHVDDGMSFSIWLDKSFLRHPLSGVCVDWSAVMSGFVVSEVAEHVLQAPTGAASFSHYHHAKNVAVYILTQVASSNLDCSTAIGV
jgi:hypothetical protein